MAAHLAPTMGLEIYQLPIPVRPSLIEMIWHRRASKSPGHRWFRGLIAPLNASSMPLPATQA